jgi:hypothetical protein
VQPASLLLNLLIDNKISVMDITKETIEKYAQKYDEDTKGTYDQAIEEELREWLKEKRYLNREMLIKLCRWKSKRPRKSYEDPLNSDERVKYITSLALSSHDEYFKITVLQLLRGVSWPTASVILAFAEPEKYSILDFRVLWSLGIDKENYSFDFWQEYLKEVREIAKMHKVSLRTLDKALWSYSKENQRKS